MHATYVGQNNVWRAQESFVFTNDVHFSLNQCQEFASLVLQRQIHLQWNLLLFSD